MYQDATTIFQWWFVLFTIGLISFPLTYLLFKKFVDLGYVFSKSLGVLIITFCIFILSTLHLVPFTRGALFAILIIYGFTNLYLFYKRRREIYSKILKKIKVIIISELIFTAGLVSWAFVRGFQPDIEGLEKFMDFGFINSLLSTRYLPPTDMWFAGQPINYYWFGHLVTATITKISNIPSAISFNLMIASILGLTLASSFSVVATLIRTTNIKLDKRVALAAGIISALLLTFGGNFHAPYYILKDGSENYWYPDATRFIGYNPETNDKTIHEFPIYSFVVSDLHAHLINLPFVLLYIALLASYVLDDELKFAFTNQKSLPAGQGGRIQNPKLFKRFDTGTFKLFGIWNLEFGTSLKLAPLGLVLGVMFMTSTWDFGNYLLVSGVVLFLTNLKKYASFVKSFWLTARLLIIVVFLAFLTALPFILNFTSLAQGIRFVSHRTPLWQLGILWGYPAILTIIFSIFIFTKTNSFIYKFRKHLKTADIFVASLLLASLMLIIIPEIIFVKDIYIATHERANTMFKLTYQAFVMSYLSSGYIAVRILSGTKNLNLRRIAFIIFMLLFAAVLTYPSFAINSYYGELKDYKGLSGETWLKKRYPDEYATILWLRENVQGQPVILEAPGDSYTDYDLISSYTGYPTVSGWYVHEWLWRGNPDFPQKRVEDIIQIYTGSGLEVTKLLLEKYNVEYVIVGTFERQKYPNLNEEKFSEIGRLVFSSENTSIYQIK